MQNATIDHKGAPSGASTAESPLQDLAFALRDVVLQVRRSGPGDGRDKAAIGLLSLLMRLGPARAGSLAEHACLDPSTVSRHLKELEGAGQVVRRGDPDDGRATVLEVSPAGRELVAAATAQRIAVLESAVANWPTEDVNRITELVRRLANDLENN
jgi:DNA-binding MarR family transcriptional regulator